MNRAQQHTSRPYWIRVEGKQGVRWTARHCSREHALSSIRDLQKKGYRIVAFVNNNTGNRLQIPLAKRGRRVKCHK